MTNLARHQRAAMSYPEPDTEPIPVYREPVECTQPIPVYREPPILSHPQIRPELHRRPMAAPKDAAKPAPSMPGQRTVSAVMFIIAVAVAALLYQLPIFGHP